MTAFDFSKVTPRQQEIADAIAETGVFFVSPENEYALICDVEGALPDVDAVAGAFVRSGDINARAHAEAVVATLGARVSGLPQLCVEDE